MVRGRAGSGGKLFDDRLARRDNDGANVFNLFHRQAGYPQRGRAGEKGDSFPCIRHKSKRGCAKEP